MHLFSVFLQFCVTAYPTLVYKYSWVQKFFSYPELGNINVVEHALWTASTSSRMESWTMFLQKFTFKLILQIFPKRLREFVNTCGRKLYVYL